MTDSFHLPKISLEGLEKIIIAYSHVPDNPTLDILARLTKMGSAAISRNNKFLMDIGIIAGAADKTVTPLGQKLGHALEYAMGADAQAYWREAISSNSALMALMTTEHLQSGMSEKDLSAHILDVSVHKKHAHTQTGARCLIDILLESGLLVQDKDKLAAAPAKSTEQPEPAVQDHGQIFGLQAEDSAPDTKDSTPQAALTGVHLAGQTTMHPELPSIMLNLTLPETEDLTVYEKIFRALRENLLGLPPLP
ncbi:hypothetical protein APT_00422 [Acetobacter pasteurianus NBRC 101655]|uniref:hypothetical protein n=1 Tax=Acetobacter pasteurianus TaxID=438 RepID=UPI000245751D|nr:hypothetical protein [Acetobacter pasteurianus]BAU37504.1 hypothetical protein APT_00422 [Acetobacter pasteurianus NBRC 101655]CCT60006.1 hypothetical protein APA386B_1943 [Acetobacter pasteurianus 386B]